MMENENNKTMNVYEVQITGTFFYIAAGTTLDAMCLAIEKRDGYEDEFSDTITATLVKESDWPKIMLDDNREDAGEDEQISLHDIMAQYGDLSEATVIASEDY